MDAEVTASLTRSHLAGVPFAALERLTSGSTDLQLAPGTVFAPAAHAAEYCYLLVRGLIRSFLLSPEGRQVTVRYSQPGSLIGLATLFSSGPIPAGLQAVTGSRVLLLDPKTVRSLARTDARVGHAMLVELSDRVIMYMNTVGEVVFSSLHDRVLAHLLDIAELGRQNSELSARISQQDLADQVGTVREVVVRILREFRAAGLVRTERDRIVVLDVSRCRRELGRVRQGSPLRTARPSGERSGSRPRLA
ncbi:Crp/Fnr family transcriptional regulator [Allosaccharopolyspora coralli]|nr:Crp/Fnr family transcriptional regulator [Allosaccharopolyspora coralli]